MARSTNERLVVVDSSAVMVAELMMGKMGCLLVKSGRGLMRVYQYTEIEIDAQSTYLL